MIRREKPRSTWVKNTLLFVFALSTMILGYSYYKLDTRFKEATQPVQERSLISINEELDALACGEGVYADLLVKYGIFEYGKFKKNTQHCTVNSPFPIGAGMCDPNQ